MRIALEHVNASIERAVLKSQDEKESIDRKRARREIQRFATLFFEIRKLNQAFNKDVATESLVQVMEDQGIEVVDCSEKVEAVESTSKLEDVVSDLKNQLNKDRPKRGRKPKSAS